MEIDDSVAHTGKKSLKVVGIVATGTPWHTKVRHESVPVENGKTFTVAFWAKVDAEEEQSREVDVSVQLQDDEWPGSYNNTIVIDSTDWKEYTDTFAITADVVESARIGLSVAQSDVDFWIDDFRFFEGEPVVDEIKEAEKEVSPMDKLPASWGKIKAGY